MQQLTPQQALENLKQIARIANKAGLIDFEATPAIHQSLAILQSLIPAEKVPEITS